MTPPLNSLLQTATFASTARGNDSSNNDDNNNVYRLLLQGPSQCGKTSLLMDLACSIASNNNDHYDNDGGGGDSDEDDAIVTFFTPAKNHSNVFFPLLCSSSSLPSTITTRSSTATFPTNNSNPNDQLSQFTKEEIEFQKKMDRLNQQEKNINNRTRKNHDDDNNCTNNKNGWNSKEHLQTLHKIKIKYLDSVHDLFHFLSCYNNQYDNDIRKRKKNKAIIIDDLDYFIKDHDIVMEDKSNSSGGQMNESRSLENNGNSDNNHIAGNTPSIPKALFHEYSCEDEKGGVPEPDVLGNDVVSNHNNYGSRTGIVSTIEMMRLVQLCKCSFQIQPQLSNFLFSYSCY